MPLGERRVGPGDDGWRSAAFAPPWPAQEHAAPELVHGLADERGVRVHANELGGGEAKIDLLIARFGLAWSSHWELACLSRLSVAKAQRASGSGAVVSRAPASRFCVAKTQLATGAENKVALRI